MPHEHACFLVEGCAGTPVGGASGQASDGVMLAVLVVMMGCLSSDVDAGGSCDGGGTMPAIGCVCVLRLIVMVGRQNELVDAIEKVHMLLVTSDECRCSF